MIIISNHYFCFDNRNPQAPKQAGSAVASLISNGNSSKEALRTAGCDGECASDDAHDGNNDGEVECNGGMMIVVVVVVATWVTAVVWWGPADNMTKAAEGCCRPLIQEAPIPDEGS